MSEPPGDRPPADKPHEHDSWLEQLSHLGLVNASRHLPFSKILLSLLFVGAATAATVLFVSLLIHWEDRRDAARADGQADARDAAVFMEGQIQDLVDVATTLANDLTAGVDEDGRLINQDVMVGRLVADHRENPGFWGVGVCFERPIDEPEANLYCPYYTRPDGEQKYTPVIYDYTDPCLLIFGSRVRGDWYQGPRDEGARLNQPYFGTTSQQMVLEYVVPVFASPEAQAAYPSYVEEMAAAPEVDCPGGTPPHMDHEGRPVGAVFVNFTLDQIRQSVSWLNLGGSGYGFVFSGDGSYVTHPLQEYFDDPLLRARRPLKPQRTIFEMGEMSGNEDVMNDVFERRAQGGIVEYEDEVTGLDAWIFFEPVGEAEPANGTTWDLTLGSVIIRSEVLGRDATAQHVLIWIGVSVLLALFALITLIMRMFHGAAWLSWGVVGTFAVLCILGTLYIWWLARTTPAVEVGLGGDGQGLTEIVENYRHQVEGASVFDESRRNEPLVEILTGVSIDFIEQGDRGHLVVGGIAWQRFFNPNAESDLPITPGLILSEDIGTTEFVQRYDLQSGSDRVIGWSFRTTLRGPSDVGRYPFDRGEVSIRLSTVEIDRPVILIPDVPAYPLIAPVAQPGIGDRVGLQGWSVERSYFGYQPNRYTTGLGLPGPVIRQEEPELFFTILLERDSFDPFVSRMLPVVAVSTLVFLLLLVITHTRLRPEDFPPSTGIVSLSFMSALMFVLILGHNSLRSSLDASELIYLENFYAIMYVAILFVALRVISMIYGIRVGWAYYRDNLTLDRLYWPFITLATLIATIAAFY